MNWPLALSPALRWVIGGVLGVVLIAGAVLWQGAREEADDTHNQSVGAAVQREASQAATIQNVEKANEAREEIKQTGPTGDAVRYQQCLRTARTPANCQRYAVPVGSTDKR